jgi:hypothetical protein
MISDFYEVHTASCSLYIKIHSFTEPEISQLTVNLVGLNLYQDKSSSFDVIPEKASTLAFTVAVRRS